MNIYNILYINLNFRKDRSSHIERQLATCSTPHSRVSGVVALDYEKYKTEPYVSKNPLTYKGTIGCFLSHIKAITSISGVESSKDYLMIIEDDVNIDNKFWSYLKKLNPSPEFDFIFFNSGRVLSNDCCIDSSQGLWCIDGDYPNFCGAFCYAIPINKLSDIQNKISSVETYIDFDRFIFTHPSLKSCTYQNKLVSMNCKFSSDRNPKK